MTETTTSGPGSMLRWWAVIALTLSFLVVGLDSYVLVTALPTLSTKLGASTGQLQWITTAYTLAWAGLLLPAGKIGDKLGRRRVLLAGLVVFGVASILASRATTADELIVMRAIMGAGAAVIMPMAMAVIPAIFPAAKDRGRAIAVTTVGAVLGLPLGPLLGGWLLTHFAWGSVFLVNVPVVVVTLLGVRFLIPESRDPSNPRLDWIGALMVAGGVVGVVYGIIQQPADGWSAPVLVALVGGPLLLAGFLRRQQTTAAPLVELGLFGNRTFTWGTVAFALISFAQAGMLFVLTPYLQVVEGADAQLTGIRLLPMIGGLLAAAAFGQTAGVRIGVKIMIPVSMVTGAAGLLILLRAHAGSGYGIVAVALAVFGIGLGLGLPLAADVVLGTLPPHQTGMGSGLSRTMQSVGVALGTAVLGSVLNNAYRHHLARSLAALPGPARSAATESVAGAHAVANRTPGAAGHALIQAAGKAYLSGMTGAIWITIGLLGAGAVLALIFLPTTAPAPAEHAATGKPISVL